VIRAACPWLLLCVLLAGCQQGSAPAESEPVIVTAQVERARVTPGHPFELSVEVDRREDVEFGVPDVGAGIRGLVIMDMREEGPESGGGRVLTRTIYKLKAPLSGTYLVPGVEGAWSSGDGSSGTAGSGPILIEAAHAAGEEGSSPGELRDLKPARKPATDPTPLVVAGVLIVLLLGAILLYRRTRRGEATEAVRPPREIALEALRSLRRSGLMTAADQGPFAYQLSAILRRYLEAVFGFPAWRMTTPELLRAMPQELLQRRKMEKSIRYVLEASDLVKFAGERVPQEVLGSWLDDATAVVHDTAPASIVQQTQSGSEAGP